MNPIRRQVMNLLADEEAASGAEYSLLIALIAMAIFATVGTLGNTVYTKLYASSIALLPFGS